MDVTCQSDAEFPQIVCGPGLSELFHSLLYKSNLPSGVVHSPNGADEHQANDAGVVLVVVRTGLVGVVVGTRLGGELRDGLDLEDGRGRGLSDAAGLDRADQRIRADLARHFGAAASDTPVSPPDPTQA